MQKNVQTKTQYTLKKTYTEYTSSNFKATKQTKRNASPTFPENLTNNSSEYKLLLRGFVSTPETRKD